MKNPVSSFLYGLPALLFLVSGTGCNEANSATATKEKELAAIKALPEVKTTAAAIDTAVYNNKMMALSNHDSTGKWPVKTSYPLAGALLPYNRIVAYYGNLYSKRMGVLGEYPRDEMIKKLQEEVAKWQAADTTVKTIPALHYIASTAQAAPGKDNKHRMRMPLSQIDTIMEWAKPMLNYSTQITKN